MTRKLSTLPPLAPAAALAGSAMPAVGPDSSRTLSCYSLTCTPKDAVSEPQVRYGRYTVNTALETEQQDLTGAAAPRDARRVE